MTAHLPLFPHGCPADVVQKLDAFRDAETQHFARQLAKIDAAMGTAPAEQLDALRWSALGGLAKWLADRPKRIEQRLAKAGLAPEPEVTAWHRQPEEREILTAFAEALRSIGTDAATRAEIAAVAGATPRMVCYWQAGEYAPRIEHIIALSRRYDAVWNVLAVMADREPVQLQGAA